MWNAPTIEEDLAKGSICELCQGKDRLVADHNHKTGMFRGWVCYSCNLLLGKVEGIGLDNVVIYIKERGQATIVPNEVING